MDAMTFTAQQLNCRQPAGCPPHAVRGRSHTEDLRVLLEEFGAQSARSLGQKLDLPAGRIGALLKWDMKVGRVVFHDGVYELVPDWQPPQRAAVLREGQELIQWHRPSEKLPDVDLLVLLEMEDVAGEPVWPGYLDGDQWTLADGMPVANVVRWAEMPRGGGA